MANMSNLSIPASIALILVLGPLAIDGWEWIYSIIGGVVLVVVVVLWRSRHMAGL